MSFTNSCMIRSNNIFKLCQINSQHFSRMNVKRLSDKQGVKENTVSQPPPQPQASAKVDLTKYVYPTNFQKSILVWVGKFKNKSEIPKQITPQLMDTAYSKARIKTCNYMLVISLIGCAFTIISGRRAQQRGESITQMNLDWHKEMDKVYQDKAMKEKE